MARSSYTPRHGSTPRRRLPAGATALVSRPVVGAGLAVGLLASIGAGATVAAGNSGQGDTASGEGLSSSLVATTSADDAARLGDDRRAANTSRSASREQERIDLVEAEKAKEKRKADARRAEAKKKAQAKAKQKAQEKATLQQAQDNPRAVAQGMLTDAGMGADQWSCLETLWVGESGWRWDAENPSSGAYGIPQSLPASKMATAGADWKTNPVTQIRWGIDYIQAAYGSPCGALAHWNAQSPHWY